MQNAEQQFLTRLRETVVSLPFDLKLFFELLTNEDQSDEVRHLAAGVVIYVLGQADLIPDHVMPVGFVDDALLLWISLDELQKNHPQVNETFRPRFPEQFEALESTIEIFRSYLGELYDWLAAKVPGLVKLVYKGKVAADYVQDADAEEFLYNEAMAFATDFDLEQDYLEQHLTRSKQVTEVLSRRMAEEQLRPK